MRAVTPNPLRLALFWFGIQSIWGAVLGISLQARTIELSTGDALVAYGRIATVGAIVAAVVQVLAGLSSDALRRRGSRRIEFYVFGAVAGSVALAWFYDAPTIFALTLAFVAVQGTLNVAIGPYQAIIPDTMPAPRIGAASSWMAALQSAGNAVGALAASFIPNGRALGGVLDLVLLGSCAGTCTHLAKVALPPLRFEPWRLTRAFFDLFLSRCLIYVGFYTLLGYLLFYVTSVLGASTLAHARTETGVLIVGFTLVGALGAGLAARPTDRVDKRLVATIGAGAFICALAIFIGSHAIAAVVIATGVAGLGWGAFLVADWAIACRVLPSGAMAASMGVWNIAIVLAQIVAPALATAVIAHFSLTAASGARAAFGLALGESLIGIAWLWRLSRCEIGE